jgi:integrase
MSSLSAAHTDLCWEDGRPPHPDTITRRFKRLAERAGLPLIDIHDVRHTYATAGQDAKIDWKALSQRIGHADVTCRCGIHGASVRRVRS